MWATGCASSHAKPCLEGGQPAREGGVVFQGIRKCEQHKDADGKFVNDGKYFEWYSNDKIALMGEYRMGKKSGRWMEFDKKGKKISDQYFEEGKEPPRP
jgi:hypothetical protein